MPTVTLNWNQYTYLPVGTPYTNVANWITIIKWYRTTGNILMPQSPGVYVVENPGGTPVYAGQADNVRSRFDGRSDALHELGLTAAPMPNHRIKFATVAINPANYAGGPLNWAEHWLIRFLTNRETTRINNGQQAARLLQNINLTLAWNAPADGLTIFNNGANSPAYLVNPVSNLPNYVYLAGAPI